MFLAVDIDCVPWNAFISRNVWKFETDVNVQFMKVILVGDTSVGKTSMICRLINGEFNPSEIRATTSFAISTYRGADPDDPEIQIWDTAGMEKYRAVNMNYYRDAAAALLVFDLSNRSTFDNARTIWKSDFEQATNSDNAFIFLIGNKCDLADSMEVSEEEARNWANMNNINYFQTSALTGEGLTEVVDALMKMLPRHHTPIEVVEIATERKKWRCC